MIDKFTNILTCELCGNSLYLDTDTTLDEYTIYMSITTNNINDKIDDIMADYLMYTCVECGHSHKYTTKEIERLLRKQITERALVLIARDTVDIRGFLVDKFLIYCGKCQGMDGKGSCSKTVLEKCEIKRFPVNEL